jgi:hypothetical protein
MQLQPDTLLQNRYRVVALIAQGGMGAVYQAIDTRLGNTVALKQTLVADTVLRAAFEREARLLASLHHPALPVVSDHFIEGTDQFLVMQFIPGDDLARLMTQRVTPFSPEQVVAWGDELLDALAYLHSHYPPIIHRDIKPQNLKIGPRGNLVLLDFGLAKGALPSLQSTGGGQSIFGYTPQYAPLEQIQGTGTDERSDLYSLAATLYQLVTGQVPPDALTRAATTLAGKPDPLTMADRVNPAVPQPLAALLQQTLSQNPATRPQSAVAMRAALRTVLDPVPLVVPPPVPTPVNSSGQATVVVGNGSESSTAGVVPPALVSEQPVATVVVGPRPVIGRFVLIGVVLLVLLVSGVATYAFIAQRSTEATGGTGVSVPTPGVAPTIASGLQQGTTRANPVPFGQQVAIPGWNAQVQEVVRGRPAWNLLYEANGSNDPAPDGFEYLLIRLKVETTFTGEPRQLYPKLTSNDRVERLPASAVTPAPDFPSQVEGGQSFEGWLTYLIPLEASQLILKIEELSMNEDTYPLYAALEEGAALADDPALQMIEPDKKGLSPGEPVIFGETAITEDWEVTLLEAIRGEAAMERLLQANQFNDPPEEGMEYVIVRVAARYIGSVDNDDAMHIDSLDFVALPGVGSNPETDTIPAPAIVEPNPIIDAYLFPGGQNEGWITLEVPINQPEPLLVFEPSFDFNNVNRRFFALQ